MDTFFGRDYEAQRLAQWLGGEGCRLVSIVGVGGAGKTALAAKTAKSLAGQVDLVVWRSLATAPRPESFLAGLIQAVSGTQLGNIPTNADEQLHMLLGYLSQSHLLLVLDSFESVLDQTNAGDYLPGSEAYGHLLDLFVHWAHSSQMLLTSRTRPGELSRLEVGTPFVRSLLLDGLDIGASRELLAHRGLEGTAEQEAKLFKRYAGNPLALTAVADMVDELYLGDLDTFLGDETTFFGEFRMAMAEQVDGLSEAEEALIAQLAELGTSVTLAQIQADLFPTWSQAQLIETLQSLQHRLLIERAGIDGAGFSLSAVWIAYLKSV